MTQADAPAHKQCPDCAEQVLAAARKCRYCGYRFDRRQSAGGSLFDGLVGALRKDTSEATFEELLADWGTSLGGSEEAKWFRLAEVDQRPGYVLLTSERFLFFNQTSPTTHERAIEHPLTLLCRVRLSGRAGKRRLELRMGTLDYVVQGPRSADLEWLSSHLERVAVGNRAASASGAGS